MPSQLSFPNEFPYEFDSMPFTDTEEDERSDDEADFLAGLTRRLALSTQRLSSNFSNDKNQVKREVKTSSTESTLSQLGDCSASGNGSPNGPFSQVPSPPTSPFPGEEAWDVISAAAGEVAKIKLSNFDSKLMNFPNPNPNSLPIPPQNRFLICQTQSFHHQSLIRFESPLQHTPIRRDPLYHHSSWSSTQPIRGVFPTITTMKQPSSGTGVFLPRRYPNPSDSCKKPGIGGYGRLPTKIVHPQKQEFPNRCQQNSQPCLSTGHTQLDYELMVGRSGVVGRQASLRAVGGGMMQQGGRPLPQEWMY